MKLNRRSSFFSQKSKEKKLKVYNFEASYFTNAITFQDQIMRKLVFLLIILFWGLGNTRLSAQEKHKPIYGQNLPQFFRIDDSRDITYLFPEFYSYQSKHIKDTTWIFECYDSRDSIMKIDTVHDINEVRYFSLFKSYTDSAHTYKDSDGKKQLLPVSSILQRYDRAGKDKWISINYSHNKYTELKEFPHDVVKTDTVIITDPITGKNQLKLYQYYKIIPLK